MPFSEDEERQIELARESRVRAARDIRKELAAEEEEKRKAAQLAADEEAKKKPAKKSSLLDIM